MTTLADLLVKVGVDAKDVEVGFNKAESAADRFGKKMSSVGETTVKAGKNLTKFATLPIAGLAVVASNAASDLNESVNAINVTFGSAVDTIEKFGETSAETVGLSTRAFNELVTPVGAALQNVGFSADEAADASINLAKRASDMASVFNVDVSDALGAIQAGLRGEADPLERFGVGLSAAAVTAHALETGLVDTAAELDDNTKAQARLSLLMEQTDRIAGDFANTAGEVANAERIMKAEAENAAAEFGQKLLPAKAKLIAMASSLIDRFSGLSDGTQNMIIKVGVLVAALGPVLLVFGSMFRAIGAIIPVVARFSQALVALGKVFLLLSRILLANPWILVAAAIVALVIVVVKNWDKIKSAISTAWNFIKKVTTTVWNAVVGFLKRNWKIILAVITGPLGALVILIASNWNKIKSTTSRIWNAIVSFIKGIPGKVVSGIRSLISRVRGVMNDVWNGARRATIDRVNSIISFVRGIPGKIRKAIPNPINLLRSIGRSIIQGLWNGLNSKLDSVRNLASSIGGMIKNLKGPEREDRKLLIPEGEAIIAGLVGGMESALPILRRLLGDVTGEIQTGVDASVSTAGVATPPPGEPTRVVFDFTGADSEMARALRNMVRVQGGGDVQEAFGVA